MLETLGVALGITVIVASLVGTGIAVAVVVTVLRQFNNIGDRHQEIAYDLDKEWKGF